MPVHQQAQWWWQNRPDHITASVAVKNSQFNQSDDIIHNGWRHLEIHVLQHLEYEVVVTTVIYTDTTIHGSVVLLSSGFSSSWRIYLIWIRLGCRDTLAWYSVSPIYRGRVYRGIGYIAVTCWTPFFCPPILRILQTWRPRARYFSRNRGNSLHSIRGRQFAWNLLTAIAFVPVRWRKFFAKSTRAYLSMRAGTHAVRREAMLGGALTPPLCRRVGST